ncbi:hypothetical protein D3C72_491480 [compost metagenome]
MSPNRLTQLALTLVALVALAGCGKAAPLQAEKFPSLVDDSLTRGAAKGAQRLVVDQQQQARDAERRAETTKVGAPSDDTDG